MDAARERTGASTSGDSDGIAEPRVVVVIPCFNEAPTVGKVVRDFHQCLPTARIVVFDNNSTDGGGRVAQEAGAEVIHSPVQGKGNVIRHMVNAVSADIYVLVDADDTYAASAAPAMVERLRAEHLDMVVGARLDRYQKGAFRGFHLFGNHLITGLVNVLFGARLTDVLSGYRVLSRTFVDVVRLRQGGFEVETEMTAQAFAKGLAVAEMPAPYGVRVSGSVSKLNTWSDGFLIAKSIVLLFKDYKPLGFFSALAFLLAVGSVLSGIGPLQDFIETGYVPRIPRAILATGLGILSIVFLTAGLILDTVAKLHEETIALWRLSLRNRR